MAPAGTHVAIASPRGRARYREVRKVTLIGSVVDLALGVAKIAVGLAAHSQALLADGIHSLSDLATDVLVLFAARHAHRAADESHPYGHGRIETVASVALGVALFLVAAGITWDSVRRLFEPDLLLKPGPLALVIAAISVLSKEAIYHYTIRAARRLRSNMLRANAWHSRSDAISSILVIIGVAGAMAGLPYLDAVAAVAVAIMIAKIAWDLVWQGLRELVDTALEADEVQEIRERILAVDGVRQLHMLRTRRSGADVLIDVHILVDPTLSVSEGHQIGEKVRETLLREIEDVRDVTVHIDPEDDELASPNDGLPLRAEILARLEQAWRPVLPEARFEDVTLHYLDGRIHVDLVLPLELAGDAAGARALADRIRAAVADLPEIGAVRVLFR